MYHPISSTRVTSTFSISQFLAGDVSIIYVENRHRAPDLFFVNAHIFGFVNISVLSVLITWQIVMVLV